MLISKKAEKLLLLAFFTLFLSRGAALRLRIAILRVALAFVGCGLLLHALLLWFGGRRRSLLEQREALAEGHGFSASLTAALTPPATATGNLNNTRARHHATQKGILRTPAERVVDVL